MLLGCPIPSILLTIKGQFMFAFNSMIWIGHIPMTTFPPHLLTRLLMSVPAMKSSPSWKVSLVTTRFGFNYKINRKWYSLHHGEPSHIVSFPLDLRTFVTLNNVWCYMFHNLVHIILAFLDSLTTQSNKRLNHLTNLHIIFLGCHHYNIWLNPLKRVFYIVVGCLIGFIISQ